MSAVAVVPAYNEERLVGTTVSALRSLEQVDRVIVVDDGSTDGTASQAAAAGAQTLRLPANRGKGAALRAGIELAGQDADVILFIDADLGKSASEADALLAPVLAGEADMTVAVFPPPPGKAGFGLVKGLARWGIWRLGDGFEAQAPLSGQRALSKDALRAVSPLPDGFGVEVAMTVRALRHGLRVVEVTTSMTHSHTGRDAAGFLHRSKQFAHVAGALVRLALERH
ncbi:MAG: glycosyltransferase family 2 protein [Coriobacteriia bacterium]